MAILDPERAKQLFREGGKAFALPAGVMGGIITTENDVIRIFGIMLFNNLPQGEKTATACLLRALVT